MGFIVEQEHHSKIKYNDLNNISSRQVPPKKINDLKISGGEHINGLWSAPFDWPVIGIHSTLLSNGKVLTFGSYSVVEKENKDIRANKKITLSDGREVERDAGDYQWFVHDALVGSDFDIWDPAKGVDDNSHETILKPIHLDAFCSIVRVLDENTIFILGGNAEVTKDRNNQADFQKNSTILKLSSKKFLDGYKLKYPRWYGSLVRTANDNFVMLGGTDVHPKGTGSPSYIPEIFEKKSDGSYTWKVLNNASNTEFFGDKNFEFNYPRSFLTSKGDIFGLSYNKMWVMPFKDNYNSIRSLGNLKLEDNLKIQNNLKDRLIDHKDNKLKNTQLKILQMSSPVGDRNNAVMIGKDQIIILGGIQTGEYFSASNKVKSINFSNIKDIKIKDLKSMNFARQNSNTTILPTGSLFVNGGSSYKDDYAYSVFDPEIYDFNTDEWSIMSKQHFRRNYHSASLLLPDGSVLVTGGDMWNAEIFYPPYLFTKNENGETLLAKRPIIKQIPKIIKGDERKNVIISIKKNDIKKISMISTGSTTHAAAVESKFTFLEFSKIDENKLKVEIPENKNFIQNGTYLIFLINEENVPSVGEIITLK